MCHILGNSNFYYATVRSYCSVSYHQLYITVVLIYGCFTEEISPNCNANDVYLEMSSCNIVPGH
jgi:hypothetical protein